MLYFQLLLFGVCIGLFSGMLGIGGGIILVPGLIFLFGFTQHEAQGTSLAALSTPIFAFAAVLYYQYGYVKLPTTAAVAVGIMIGAYIGARLIPFVPVVALRLAFGGILLYVGLLFVFSTHLTKSTAALPAGIAFLITLLGAYVRGKKVGSLNLPPIDDQTDYHI